MRTLSVAALLVFVTSTVAFAQEPTAKVDPRSVQILEPPNASHAKVADKTFWLIGAALNTAMVLDTKSTFDVSKRCASCYEADPVVAPFVVQGPATTFAAGEAFDIGVMALAAKMKGSSHSWARHTWWVVPIALTTGHAIAFRHNNNLAR